MRFEDKKLYEESPDVANRYRKNFKEGLERFIETLNTSGKQERTAFFPPEALPEKIEEYRSKYRDMLGIPRVPDGIFGAVEKTYVATDDVCDIFRVAIGITEEIPMYGLLLMPKQAKEPMPLVIAQHGGGGTPELCSDFHGENNYNHMVQRALSRGAAVFAPQLLLWNIGEKSATCPHYEPPYSREVINTNLVRFGLSVAGIQIAGISKAIDYLCTLPEIDGKKIGMIGLSYGGYFTLYTMAADTRIRAGYACACFNDRDAYPWQDMVFPNSGRMFQDAEVAALCAPRKLYVSIGKEDEVFTYQTGIPEAERVKPYFAAMGAEENFVFDVHSGGHTVKPTDEGYDFLFEALK
ncbi:MAG: dienelactone hydrolase family protein [Clostridia bacterium]|nr:dienelactone hydrolase family protein [Clostridia bacterium]